MKQNWKWTKKYLEDNSGYWWEHKIFGLNWVYSVDKRDFGSRAWVPVVFINSLDGNGSIDEIEINPSKTFRTKKEAMLGCEKHFITVLKGVLKYCECGTS